jgi:2-hydroxy-3-oxopropionate reductase
MPPTITVFGLGLMGRPMARALRAAGVDARGWNRSPLDPEAAAGIPLCSSLDEAARAEICLLMLRDQAATDEVLARIEPLLRPGALVLDMGSNDPRRSRAHAARLAARGVGWVDAPVSGGPEGAAAGALAIMAGGTAGDVARARPVLDALGRVTHVGGAGAGHTAKAVNQAIVGMTLEAVAEALLLAERSGLDPRLVQQALAGGLADSLLLQRHGTRMIARTYLPGGRAAAQLKDLRLAMALADEAGLRLPHLASVTGRFAELVARGDGDLDHAAIHKLLLEQQAQPADAPAGG